MAPADAEHPQGVELEGASLIHELPTADLLEQEGARGVVRDPGLHPEVEPLGNGPGVEGRERNVREAGARAVRQRRAGPKREGELQRVALTPPPAPPGPPRGA